MERIDQEKQRAARAAVELIEDGMVVGLGAGSTVFHAVQALGERVRAGLRVKMVPASLETDRLARGLGIDVISFEDQATLDLAIDGADEVDSSLRLIKGGGGALLREKVVAVSASKFIVIADSSKLVAKLGRFPLPVEVLPFAAPVVEHRLKTLGVEPKLRRQADGSIYLTNQNNYIFDMSFGAIDDPEAVAEFLTPIPGLIEHGLFLTEASLVLIARGDTVEELRRPE